MFKIISLFLPILLSLAIASCCSGSKAVRQSGAATMESATQSTAYITMPESTIIAVTLIDSIDTDVQVSGTEFHACLSRPVVVNGYTLFADDAAAKGILTKVVESGGLNTPAELNFRLTAIQDRNGHWINVSTYTIQEKMALPTNRETAMIAGGTIVGGIIGRVYDKKGSTEIGAVSNATADISLSAATGKPDISHRVGTVVVFSSNEPTHIALK